MVELKDLFGVGGVPKTFLGLPEARDWAALDADIVIFGADCATPYAQGGAYCAGGPGAMRGGAAAYAGDLSRLNFDLGGPVLPDGVRVVDAGDLATDPGDAAGNRARIGDAIPADRRFPLGEHAAGPVDRQRLGGIVQQVVEKGAYPGVARFRVRCQPEEVSHDVFPSSRHAPP